MDPTELDPPTAALVRLAAVVARGGAEALDREIARVRAADVPAAWVEELLLQSVLMAGYPRALAATAAWRRASGIPAPAEDAEASLDGEAWLARGEAACRRIYGENYEKLRRNVRALHPALDAWMVAEGYGRTIGRPGLDLVRRELCTVAQTAVQRAGPQLHSHLRGARNAGASDRLIASAIEAMTPVLEDAEAALLRETWETVRVAGARSRGGGESRESAVGESPAGRTGG